MVDLIEETEIPVPDNPGSSGEQELATREVLPEQPQLGLPVVDALVRGLAASPRSLGEFGSAMLAGVARQLGMENQALQNENRYLQKSLGTQRNELENERIEKAVLAERVRSEQGSKHLRHFGVSVGTALLCAGVLPSPIVAPDFSSALFALGLPLLLISWFSPFRRKDTTTSKEGQE